jgi:cytochrome P450
MLHDEETYGSDTDIFRPERFLKSDGSGELDPSVPHPDVAFGFGRRFCPGQKFSEAIIWLTVACIVACFDIEPAAGEPLDERYTTGLNM